MLSVQMEIHKPNLYFQTWRLWKYQAKSLLQKKHMEYFYTMNKVSL